MSPKKRRSTDGIRRKQKVPASSDANSKKESLKLSGYSLPQKIEEENNISKSAQGGEQKENHNETPLIITSPAESINSKQQAGSSTVGKISDKKISPWIKKLREARHGSDVDSLSSAINDEVERHKMLRWGIILGVGGILVLVILLSTIFASLTITIQPRKDALDIDGLPATLVVKENAVEAEKGIIPALKIEIERDLEKEFKAAGKKTIKEKARGKVRIYNAFSSSPQVLVETTRLLTDSGVLFRITKRVTVPGAKIKAGKIVPQFVEVEAAADKPGEQSNLPKGTEFKIPGFKGKPQYEGFYAVAQTDLSGGFEGEITVISEQDVQNASKEVTTELFNQVRKELAQQVPTGFILVENLSTVLITKVDHPPVGTKLDEFRLKATAAGKAFVFKKEDMAKFIEAKMNKQQEQRKLVWKESTLEYLSRNIDFDKETVSINIKGKALLENVIPTEQIAEKIKGQKEGTVVNILKQYNEISSFKTSFFPLWRFRAPSDPKKIEFRVLSSAAK